MRRNQIPSAAERERLLAGQRVEGQRLSELIAAATVSARTAEPPGLESALAAFRSAPAAVTAPPARRTPVLKSLLSGLVATKVIAGVAGAAAVGGVALAASTGHLGDGGHSADAPGQAIAAAHQPDATDSGSMSSSSDDSSSASTSDSSSVSSSESSTHAPTPSLVGLCHAWQAHERSQSDHSASAAHSAWAKSAAFSVLVSTAGGTDGVDGYCTALLTPSTSASTTPTSVPPTHPAHPTQAVTTHTNHKPTAVPSHSHPAPSHTNHKPTASATPSAPATS